MEEVVDEEEEQRRIEREGEGRRREVKGEEEEVQGQVWLLFICEAVVASLCGEWLKE